MEMHSSASLREVRGINSQAVHANGSWQIYAFATKLMSWIVNTIHAAVAEYVREKAHSIGIKELQRFDDRMLADIGLTRGSIQEAVRSGLGWRKSETRPVS